MKREELGRKEEFNAEKAENAEKRRVARHGRRHLQKQEDGENAFMSPGKNAGRKKAGKAASIYDVARESGVSVFTVSAVVNNKSHVGKGLRERVEAAGATHSVLPRSTSLCRPVRPAGYAGPRR